MPLALREIRGLNASLEDGNEMSYINRQRGQADAKVVMQLSVLPKDNVSVGAHQLLVDTYHHSPHLSQPAALPAC